MQNKYPSHVLVAIIALLHMMTASKVFSPCVPGCDVFLDELGEIVVKCTKFNISSTPTFLPKNISALYIYSVKNITMDIPLIPGLMGLKKLVLNFNDMHNISKVMFEGLENLVHLSLSKNFIVDIPSDAFANALKLEILDLSDNYLWSVESIAPALQNLEKLKHLDLHSNKQLRFLNEKDLVLLENTQLESLDVSSCVIDFIDKNTFKSLKLLKSLNISYNLLPEEGLSNLSFSLKKDNLQDFNAKGMIRTSYFSCRFLRWLQTTNIISLDLSENRFICFPKGNYKNLISLILDKCTIIIDSSISFAEMPNLEYLQIREHTLMGIDKEFKSNSHLKFLDLSHFVGNKQLNSFKIANYAFENQNELTSLYLKNLPIQTSIKRYMLYGLSKLEIISFYLCSIPAVECYAFETLKNLVLLDLSYNKITELLNCSFYGLEEITTINLSNNLLSFIAESHPFVYTPKLEVLNLHSNKIIKLLPEAFQKLNNLAVIRLDNNLVQPWKQSFLPRKKEGMVLFLSNNAISHFTTEMLDDIFNLDVFDFSENPINCSHCSILELRKWMLNNTSVIRKLHNHGAYVCSEPDNLVNVNIIEANLTLPYCFPEEKDILKIMCTILFPVIFIVIISLIVWYRWSWNIKYRMFLIQLNTKKYKDNVVSTQYMYDACVFYSEADAEWIRNLADVLEKGNPPLRLFLKDRDFVAGIPIFDNISSAINNSRSTVIILSNESLKDSWCLYIMQMAQNTMVKKSRSGLIVIFLEDISKDKLKKDLQYVLRTRTCIWWTKNSTGQKLFWERLRLAIMRPRDRGVSTHII